MAALERAGIPVESYDAFEIDKYAIQVSQKNYPKIIHHGDVFGGSYSDFKGYDLLIGGFPRPSLCISETGRGGTPRGVGGKRFFGYFRGFCGRGWK